MQSKYIASAITILHQAVNSMNYAMESLLVQMLVCDLIVFVLMSCTITSLYDGSW